jgi:hypothetical protein
LTDVAVVGTIFITAATTDAVAALDFAIDDEIFVMKANEVATSEPDETTAGSADIEAITLVVCSVKVTDAASSFPEMPYRA